MRVEDFLVVLGFLQLVVAKLKESLVGWHAVGGPLLHYGGETCIVNEFPKDYVAGAAAGNLGEEGTHYSETGSLRDIISPGDILVKTYCLVHFNTNAKDLTRAPVVVSMGGFRCG